MLNLEKVSGMEDLITSKVSCITSFLFVDGCPHGFDLINGICAILVSTLSFCKTNTVLILQLTLACNQSYYFIYVGFICLT